MRMPFRLLALAASVLALTPSAAAFCGFYVAKADAKLFNRSSTVLVARKDKRTVVTMASDYAGDPKEFALVVPVPTVVRREHIRIPRNGLIDHLDAYTAPRLVEYFDPDPCAPQTAFTAALSVAELSRQQARPAPGRHAAALGVKIEAQYTVGEYDVLILSATQSDGLSTWLTEEGYRIPSGAAPVLGSYIKQGMKFFLAKVNLREKSRLGFQYLRPIQVAYDTHKFMLPIRLGTVNADGPQDMVVLMLTERGRVETTNYQTRRIPSNINLPIFTKSDFAAFYKALFDTQVKYDGMKVVYLEYAWNVAWCDPCAADPIPNDKLVELGAFWLSGPRTNVSSRRDGKLAPPTQPASAFITRLHVRYDGQNFPEDLMFQETADTDMFQGRYVLNHPFRGPTSCSAGEQYRNTLRDRFAREAATLARLTGWDPRAIADRMRSTGQSMPVSPPPASNPQQP